MSVFACLGGGATLARDAFIGRLQSRVEVRVARVLLGYYCVYELLRYSIVRVGG